MKTKSIQELYIEISSYSKYIKSLSAPKLIRADSVLFSVTC